jgi:hypothetical protein
MPPVADAGEIVEQREGGLAVHRHQKEAEIKDIDRNIRTRTGTA